MTKLELTSLRNLHLKGYFGFPFSAQPKKKRLEYIHKWIASGLLDKECKITDKGIEESKPSVKPSCK